MGHVLALVGFVGNVLCVVQIVRPEEGMVQFAGGLLGALSVSQGTFFRHEAELVEVGFAGFEAGEALR